MKKYKWDDWGIQATMDGVIHKMNFFDCPHCSYEPEDNLLFYKYIVGFSSAFDGIVLECPNSFKRFWHHVSDAIIQACTHRAMEYPELFKVPGVYKEILKMLKEQKEKE